MHETGVSQAKVVEIKLPKKRQTALPPALHAVRQIAKKQLTALTQSLFDNTDDALFELADRSQSDHQQEMYFDSMRHLRLHRKAISENFLSRFVASFNDLLEPQQEEEVDDEEIDYELVEKDELEMTVAVSGIVSKVTSLHSLQIMQLTKRLSSVVAPLEVTERTNPLGPHALSTLFSESLDGLDIGIKVRIIIMKMFERFVMERMGGVYEQVNQQLIQSGVMPDLKSKPVRRRQRPQNTPSTESAEQNSAPAPGADPNAEFAFETVQSLLATSRSQGGVGGGIQGGSSSAAGLPNQGGTHSGAQGSAHGGAQGGAQSGAASGLNVPLIPIASNELLDVLSKLQLEQDEDEFDVASVPQTSDVRGLVLAGQKGKELHQADEDAVNFVGLLFDYILNDRNLAIPMKALIGRLQIPIVKVAVMDKSFFARSSHPARALLNDLSSAGIGWSSARELKRDTMYNKIEAVVHRVLNDFSTDPDVFSDLLAEFREFVGQDTRRSVLVEQRVKDTEQGKARTQQAKQTVQNLVNQKACGLRLPKEVGKFVSEIWSRVLVLRCVKFSEDSDEWRLGVEALDNLLWVLQPLSEAEDVDRRDEMQPLLVKRLRDGMEELGTPQEEIDGHLRWLSDHLSIISRNDRAYLQDDEVAPVEMPTAVVEEIVLTSTNFTEAEKELPDETEAKLKTITEGTWVEITENDTDPVRCKLATVTQPGHNYVFVNRRGMKVAEKNRVQLAGLLEQDKLSVIDESQVFDRALQSVIGNLRDLQRRR